MRILSLEELKLVTGGNGSKQGKPSKNKSAKSTAKSGRGTACECTGSSSATHSGSVTDTGMGTCAQ